MKFLTAIFILIVSAPAHAVVDWADVVDKYKFACAGMRGNCLSLTSPDTIGKFNKIPYPVRLANLEKEYLLDKDWSHIKPYSKGGSSAASNGYWEQAGSNRARGNSSASLWARARAALHDAKWSARGLWNVVKGAGPVIGASSVVLAATPGAIHFINKSYGQYRTGMTITWTENADETAPYIITGLSAAATGIATAAAITTVTAPVTGMTSAVAIASITGALSAIYAYQWTEEKSAGLRWSDIFWRRLLCFI
ncbi:MAG: hypothetical protein OXH88_01860 [Gammaproteobacteria bacterium]|nr:hypothetical protein [Gammaproteobacteria bacterium]